MEEQKTNEESELLEHNDTTEEQKTNEESSMPNKFKTTENIHDLKKQHKIWIVENSKIKRFLKDIIKHIKYLDKEIIIFKNFFVKNANICDNLNLLLSNFKNSSLDLKR